MPMPQTKDMLLWDLPTRIFHWTLVVAVAAAFVTGQLGGNLIDWHGRIGLFILGLLAFRLFWGLFGSTYARFGQFFPSPARLMAYLQGRWQGQGHNPLGALSVFALLALLGFQALSGLASNDDIAFNGPLYPLITKELSNNLTSLHYSAANFLMALIGLHLLAIVFYVRIKKHNLLAPMIHGKKPGNPQDSAQGGGWLRFLFGLIFALALVFAASGAWIAPPTPVPAAETPSW